MKRLIAFIALCVCIALVLFASPAMEAARLAVDIWWNTLLPTLFPFFVCATLMDRSGALHMLANFLHPISKRLRISNYSLPLLFLSGISGYPSGPRLCRMLQASGAVNSGEAERLGAVCNLCSPMFLAGAMAGGMLHDASLFAPLAIAHYGGAIIVAVLLRVFAPITSAKPKRTVKVNGEPLSNMLPEAFADGMASITKVGGSVIFFLVLAELFKQTGVLGIIGAPIDSLFQTANSSSPAQGILLGLLEMTGGCHLVIQAGLPQNITIPLCAFLVSFGGLSVMVQAMAFIEFKKPLRYIAIKLLHGGIAAAIAYVLVINRAGSAEAFSSSATPYAVNALSGLTTLFACALGVGAAFIFALIVGKPYKNNR